MALQFYGTRLKGQSGRHHHTSAAFLRALVDGFLDSLLVLCRRVRRLGTILGDVIVFSADLRCLDALLNLLVERFVPFFGRNSQQRQQEDQEQELESSCSHIANSIFKCFSI